MRISAVISNLEDLGSLLPARTVTVKCPKTKKPDLGIEAKFAFPDKMKNTYDSVENDMEQEVP